MLSGRRKTTRWEKCGKEGKVYAYWVWEIVWRRGGTRTGREGMRRPNIVVVGDWFRVCGY